MEHTMTINKLFIHNSRKLPPFFSPPEVRIRGPILFMTFSVFFALYLYWFLKRGLKLIYTVHCVNYFNNIQRTFRTDKIQQNFCFAFNKSNFLTLRHTCQISCTNMSTREKPPWSQIDKLENYVCKCVLSEFDELFVYFHIKLSHHFFRYIPIPKVGDHTHNLIKLLLSQSVSSSFLVYFTNYILCYWISIMGTPFACMGADQF